MTLPISILVVDDDESTCALVKTMLSRENCRVESVGSGGEAVEIWRRRVGEFDAILLDIRMPGMSGMEALAEIKKIDPRATVVMMSTISAVETAVEAIKLGAEDYITKPFQREELVKKVVTRLADRKTAERRTAALKQELRRRAEGNIAGQSPQIQKVLAEIRTVAGSDVPVLIAGESGTGKELAARAIHDQSARRDEPFVAVNCAAVPQELLESEFFGHEKGAFSGAAARKYGLFEVADGGTFFLDEIGDMPPNLQAKLLRTVESKEFRRVGGVETLAVDVRIVSATHRELKKEMEAGRFREDLFYRLSGFVIHLPPLRERSSDIPVLIKHILERRSSPVAALPPDMLDALVKYDWPGNIRELEHAIERTILVSNGRPPKIGDLPADILAGSKIEVDHTDTLDPSLPLSEIEKRHILNVLQTCGMDKPKAAKILGIGLKTLYRKLEQYKF